MIDFIANAGVILVLVVATSAWVYAHFQDGPKPLR